MAQCCQNASTAPRSMLFTNNHCTHLNIYIYFLLAIWIYIYRDHIVGVKGIWPGVTNRLLRWNVMVSFFTFYLSLISNDNLQDARFLNTRRLYISVWFLQSLNPFNMCTSGDSGPVFVPHRLLSIVHSLIVCSSVIFIIDCFVSWQWNVGSKMIKIPT